MQRNTCTGGGLAGRLNSASKVRSIRERAHSPADQVREEAEPPTFRDRINREAVGVALPQPVPFGKYTLFERIGRGGMADVFKARIQGPAGFERTFVVKRILAHLSGDPAFTKMFIDEAKIAAKLSHPEHRPGVRAGRGRRRVLHVHGVRARPRSGRDHAHAVGARRPAAPRAGGLRRPRDVPRAGLRARVHLRRRPRARHDPPRRLAVERHAVVRRRA